MTLLDAPKFDEAREKRRQMVIYSAAVTFLVLLVAWWLVAGRPVDWPWNWNNYFFARLTVNDFLRRCGEERPGLGLWRLDTRQELAAASGAKRRLSIFAIPGRLELDQSG